MSEHDAGFYFHRLSVAQVWSEAPLKQGVCNGVYLVGKGAEKMNVLYLALFINDDPNRSRIESALAKDRINSLQYVFVAHILLDAHRDFTASPPRNGTGLCRQSHFAHFLDETLNELGVPAGKDKLDHVTADLSCQDVPMQLGDGRTVVKAHEGMVCDSDKSRRLFHFVVRVQTFFVVIDQLQRVPSRCKCEEQVLGDDQNTASTCPLGCFCRPDLREYVVATVRGRRADVLLGPVRRESISESEILVAKDIVGHSPAFRDRSHQIAGTRPGALDQKEIRWERVRLRIVGKIATALWGALSMGYERNRKTNKGEGTRESRMHIQTHSLQEEKTGRDIPCLARKSCYKELQ